MRETKVLFGCGFDRDGRFITLAEEEDLAKTLRQAVVEKYGGCTLYGHEGSWKAPTGIIATERGITLSVLGIETDREAYALASFVRALFSQASVVLVKGSGEAEFVE